MTRRLIGVAVVVAIALAAVSIAFAGSTTLKISAQKVQLKYTKKTLKAKAGKITIVMKNPSILQHNVAIKGKGIKTKKGKVVGPGGTSRVTITLKPGKYRFFCSVPGHEAAGMFGALTITK
jgi:uncharacterized cupredoxin-like copper-binding protein